MHDDPAHAVLDRLSTQPTLCGSQPPPDFTVWGDCWCTLPEGHPEEECVCEVCALRHGAPGWKTER